MDGTDLIQNGVIYLEGDVLLDDWARFFESGFSARMVREALATFDGDVTLVVNSPGGHAVEGEAIRAAIAAHPGDVTVRVAGVAMSAASLMIMAATRIEMTTGSILMIHEPSDAIWGTSADMAKASEDLDVLADVYARVYATRAEITPAAAREIMRAETYLGPDAAIEAGFADAVADDVAEPDMGAPAMSAETARAAFMASQSNITMRVSQMNSRGGESAPVQPAGSPGRPPAAMAQTQEASMPDDAIPAGATPDPTPTPAAQPVPTTPAPSPVMAGDPAQGAAPDPTPTPAAQPVPTTPAPAPVMAGDPAQGAALAERARIRDIQTRAAPFMAAGRLSQADIAAAIDGGLSVEQACDRFMAQMAATEAPVAPGVPVAGQAARIGRDEGETRLEGMVQALMGKFDGPGAEFRGLRLRSLAVEMAGARRGFNEVEAIRNGMMSTAIMAGAHGVSDFAYVTTAVMNRMLMAEYDRRASNWQVVCGAPMSAADFRDIHAVRFGGDFQLKPVLENGEYESATLADQAEGLKVERRGRTIGITFEAVVNDDMGAFQRIPREFAREARLMEASMVWALIRANKALKSDNKALFHADHGNLAASGGAIDVATVGAARKAMWEQKAYGAKGSDAFMMVEPDILLVPPSLEASAGKFVAATVPTKDADGNPFKATLRPEVSPHLGAAVSGGSDAAWYLISSDLPPVTHAYLDGYEAPTVQTIEGMNPDKVTMNARHIFGAAATEFRGAYKNPGSGG